MRELRHREVRSLHKITQPGSGRVRIRIRAGWIQSPCSQPCTLLPPLNLSLAKYSHSETNTFFFSVAHSVIFITKRSSNPLYGMTLNVTYEFIASKPLKKRTYYIYLHSSLSSRCQGIVQDLYPPCGFVQLLTKQRLYLHSGTWRGRTCFLKETNKQTQKTCSANMKIIVEAAYTSRRP